MFCAHIARCYLILIEILSKSDKEFLHETTLEVLTTRRGRREAHRQGPDDVKARIVSESLRPGVRTSGVPHRVSMLRIRMYRWSELGRQTCALVL
ncbi:hypothetical protein C3Y89_24510 [Rhizobium sp. UPM1132]|nr:hypothetical protein [Rhizobium ruizarguesonis]